MKALTNELTSYQIKAGLTQEALAKRVGVTQAYISKLEAQDTVTVKILQKVKIALNKK